MNIKIESLPSYKIAYIRQYGPYGLNNFQTMNALKNYADFNSLLNNDSIILGITYDNPKITLPEKCKYDACIVLNDDYLLKENQKSFNFESNNYIINEGTTACGKYAVFEINHTSEDIEAAWKNIFLVLKQNNYEADFQRPIIERYDMKMIANHKCNICIPIL